MAKFNKEEQLLEYIKTFQQNCGYPPTVREMCRAVGVNSTSTIAYYINKLEKTGQIKKSPYKNRALEIVKNESNISKLSNDITSNITRIPMLGTVTAGQPILAVETNEECYCVSPNLFRGDGLFMLTVSGESMINAGIYNGDKIIIRSQSTAENGEIVAVLLDGCSTVKRFFKEDGHYRLQPENDTMSPIIVDNVDILGKVIGLVRKF